MIVVGACDETCPYYEYTHDIRSNICYIDKDLGKIDNWLKEMEEYKQMYLDLCK